MQYVEMRKEFEKGASKKGYSFDVDDVDRYEDVYLQEAWELFCLINTSVSARNAELLEAVKKAHEILLHEVDNGRTPSMLQGVGLGYFEDIIAGID